MECVLDGEVVECVVSGYKELVLCVVMEEVVECGLGCIFL